MKLPSITKIREVTSVEQLAEEVGIGRRTLYDWLTDGVPGKGPMRTARIKTVSEALERLRSDSQRSAA